MFWDRFFSLCQEKGIKPNSIRAELGITSTSTMTKWKNGAVPEGKVLGRIAEHFDCSIGYLLGDTDDRNPPHPEKTKKAPAEAGEVMIIDGHVIRDPVLYEAVKNLSEASMRKLVERARELARLQALEQEGQRDG